MIRMITPAAIVTTLAGQTTAGFANGTGTAAQFNTPSGITIDGSGNLYVADELNNRIRKIVISTGVVTTLSGTGSSGSANGVGTTATFYYPFGMATDASGNVFVGDYGYDLIRKIVTTPYTVGSALPPGLNFASSTGAISGTPSSTFSSTGFTVYDYNASGYGSTTINITVITSNGNPTQTQNYVITNTTRQSGIVNDATLAAAAMDKTKVQMAIQYVDGLGRSIQTVVAAASPMGNDIVQPEVYDQYGREVNKYLPYVPTTGTSGNYRSTAATDQASFYNSPPIGVVQIPTSTQVAYAATRYESSPLNRPLEQGAPGLSWQIGGGHTATLSYITNTSTDAIREWVVNSSGGASYSTTYPAGTLYKTVSTDENQNNNSIIMFKDLDGKVISRWVQNGASTYLVTDYIYDDLGNLCYVIPPLPSASGNNQAAVGLPTSFAETDNVFLNFFYGYHYDGLHRMTSKKIPGQGWQYIVYNNLDQPILTQDANQTSKSIWIVNKFDALGRLILMGEYASAASQSTLQSTANGFTSNLWESFTNATTFYGYSHNSWPDISNGTGNKVLAVDYFDNYNILSNTSVDPGTTVFTAPNPTIDSLDKAPRGLPTAELVNVVGSTNYLFTEMQYDKYERSVKTIAQNFQGASVAYNKYDTEDNQFSFQDVPTQSIRNHYLPTSSSPQLTIINHVSYDHISRQSLATQQYITPTNTGPIVNLSKMDYNELGQLMTKHLHNATTGTVINSGFLQHVDYRYNPRGWLTRINDPNNASYTDETYPSQLDVFAEGLDYDVQNYYQNTTPQYNGNISNIKWQTKLPTLITLTQESKIYTFTYDPLNRLTAAQSIFQVSGNNLYNEEASYDELGNILTLTRNNGSINNLLNSFQYNYMYGTVRSNQLQSVTDYGTEGVTSNYTYDSNGNLKSDSHKTVSGVTYNELNLPSQVTTSAKTITYNYNASGEKLERITTSGSTVLEDRTYDNGIEYVGNSIEFVQTPEGRALPSSGNYTMEYQITDHLGNVRAMFADKNNDGMLTADEITQINDYYPFGRQITYSQNLVPSPDNKYKYNGQEFQIDLSEYDYGARHYDPVIGRFNGIDIMAENHYDFTPYHYALNNPITYADEFGLDTIKKDDNKTPIKKGDDVQGADGTYTTAKMDQANVVGTTGGSSNTGTTPDPSSNTPPPAPGPTPAPPQPAPSPVPDPVPAPPIPTPDPGPRSAPIDMSYLNNIAKFNGQLYNYGGIGIDKTPYKGIDCTGYICRVMGFNHRVWDTSIPVPASFHMSQVNNLSTSSHKAFTSGLKKGDLLVWRFTKKINGKTKLIHHAAFYIGNGTDIASAHGTEMETESGITSDLDYHLSVGYPKVYRKK